MSELQAVEAAQPVALVVGNIPNLHEAEESVMSFTPEYLDVDELESGRVFKCFYLGCEDREQVDKESGEAKTLTLVKIAEQNEDGSMQMWESAAAQLVGVLKDKEKSGQVVIGKTPLKITFKGKRRNKTNSFSSARWDVRPLVIRKPVAEAA